MRTVGLAIGGLAIGLLTAAGTAQARCDGFGICRPSYNQTPGQYTNGYTPPGPPRVPGGYGHYEPSFNDYQRRAVRVPSNDYMNGHSGFQPAPTLPPWNSRRY
jgi:hypothetical protein